MQLACNRPYGLHRARQRTGAPFSLHTHGAFPEACGLSSIGWSPHPWAPSPATVCLSPASKATEAPSPGPWCGSPTARHGTRVSRAAAWRYRPRGRPSERHRRWPSPCFLHEEYHPVGQGGGHRSRPPALCREDTSSTQLQQSGRGAGHTGGGRVLPSLQKHAALPEPSRDSPPQSTCQGEMPRPYPHTSRQPPPPRQVSSTSLGQLGRSLPVRFAEDGNKAGRRQRAGSHAEDKPAKHPPAPA